MSQTGSERPETATTGIEGESRQVCNVAVRVPPFWADKPALWFRLLEGQFAISGITREATKFSYVTAYLDMKYASEVEDIIMSPEYEGNYTRLKEELIRRLSVSRERSVRQLIEHEEMGDSTPSQFLRRLRSLAGNTVPEEFLRTLWMGRLPTTVQAIVTAQTDSPLDKLADLADRISEAIPRTQVSAVAHETQMDQLATMISDMVSHKIEEVTRGRSRQPTTYRERRGSQNRRSSNSRERRYYDPDSSICWYHHRFGARATRCRKPCDYGQGNDSNRH